MIFGVLKGEVEVLPYGLYRRRLRGPAAASPLGHGSSGRLSREGWLRQVSAGPLWPPTPAAVWLRPHDRSVPL